MNGNKTVKKVLISIACTTTSLIPLAFGALLNLSILQMRWHTGFSLLFILVWFILGFCFRNSKNTIAASLVVHLPGMIFLLTSQSNSIDTVMGRIFAICEMYFDPIRGLFLNRYLIWGGDVNNLMLPNLMALITMIVIFSLGNFTGRKCKIL